MRRPPPRFASVTLKAIAALTLAAGLAACDTPPTSSADTSIRTLAQASVSSGSCAQQSSTDESLEFKPFWNCGDPISVSAGTDPVFLATVSGALNAWRGYLSIYASTQLPQFENSVGESGGDVEVVLASGAGGSIWCGSTDNLGATRKRITLTTIGCNGNKGSQRDVLIHELGHALGWTSGAHKPNGSEGHSDHCAMALPDDLTLNPTVCAHEVEGMLARYSIRNDIDPANFWNRDFVIGTTTDRNDRTLGANGTVQLTAGAFVWHDGSEAWPTAMQHWFSDAPGIATVGSTGLVSAVANGTTYAHVSSSANLSGRYLPYWLLTRGDSIRVTVSIPVDTFLRVNTINIPRSLPIHVADSFNLTAETAGDGGQGGVTVSWVIVYSNGVLPNDSTAFLGSTTYFLRVPLGSYSITAKAYPKQGSKVGSRAEMDLTVCPAPGGGGQAIRVPVPPGEDTEAVGGC